MAVTNQGTSPAFIESGRVLDVDISSFTLSVTTQFSKKPQTGITWSTPYLHFVNGEGIHFMPEVGSLCWICFPSDGNRPFVLGWSAAADEGNFRSRRPDMNPGDIYLGTRDENFLILRRGGVVQIGGGPLSQRLFLPVTNTIKDFCENYSLQTIGGELDWTVQRSENDTDGNRPTTLKILAREKASDEKPLAELQVGSHGSGQKTILSLVIKESGASGAARKISLTLSKDGDVSWTVEKDVLWTVKGKFTIDAQQDVLVKSASKVTISGGSTVEVSGQSGVTIQALTGVVTIKGAPTIQMGSTVLVGNSPQPVALAIPLLTWLSTHIHSVIPNPALAIPGGPPQPTTPPLVPPPAPAMTSTTLLASPA
ncbi:MAG: hypothetical protein E6R04_04975 [Spirochaetes bacterium]|nr:MAG: hypothetical protein E6R04_04975 [Spirochaetota bacterium]